MPDRDISEGSEVNLRATHGRNDERQPLVIRKPEIQGVTRPNRTTAVIDGTKPSVPDIWNRITICTVPPDNLRDPADRRSVGAENLGRNQDWRFKHGVPILEAQLNCRDSRVNAQTVSQTDEAMGVNTASDANTKNTTSPRRALWSPPLAVEFEPHWSAFQVVRHTDFPRPVLWRLQNRHYPYRGHRRTCVAVHRLKLSPLGGSLRNLNCRGPCWRQTTHPRDWRR